VEAILDDLGMDEEEFIEFLKTLDELEEFPFGYKKRFYVLKEREEGREERIKPLNLKKYLPLDDTQASYFAIHEFPVESMRPVQELIAKLPEELRVHAVRVAFAVVLKAVAKAFSIFDTYTNIHGNTRFRWYLTDQANPSVNPPMVYDYKSNFQREVEAATNFTKFDFTGKDLREFDFTEKDLSGIKFEGCNLRRARFSGCVVNKAEFNPHLSCRKLFKYVK
jgi:hypothetical protein